MAPTDAVIRKAKATIEPRKLFGQRRRLLVVPLTDGEPWRLRYRFAGTEKFLALGGHPEVALADARERRDAQAGRRRIDPSTDRPTRIVRHANRATMLRHPKLLHAHTSPNTLSQPSKIGAQKERTVRRTTFILVVMLCVHSFALQAGTILRSAHHVTGEYNVVLRDSADLLAVSQRHGAHVKSSCSVLMKSLTISGDDVTAQSLADDPDVLYVAENSITSGATVVQSPAPSVGLDRINQAILPLDNAYSYSYTGQNVVVYVVDSGVNQVSDLSGRLIRQINFATINGVRDPNNFGDCYGHGTPVASIIGGTVYGVAKNVKIVNVRQFDCTDSGTSADFRDAMDWVVTDHMNHPSETMALVNFSGRAFGTDQVMDDATMRVLAAGIPVIVCAGNEAISACNESPARLGNPSSYPNNPNQFSTITVSGSNEDDTFNSFLNFGPCVDILAPSRNLMAMSKDGVRTGFGASSGATPHVTGVAALRMEQFGALSPSALEGSIKDNSTPNVVTGVPAGTPNLLLYSFTIKRRVCCS